MNLPTWHLLMSGAEGQHRATFIRHQQLSPTLMQYILQGPSTYCRSFSLHRNAHAAVRTMGKGAQHLLAPPTAADVNPKRRSDQSSETSRSSDEKPPLARIASMGTGFGSASLALGNALPNAVYLNVYDVLTPDDPSTIPRLNNLLFRCGMGIYHTGVQVWNREFAFGGHPDAESGIFEVTPRKCPAVKYRTSMLLGYTKVSEPDVDALLHFLGETEFVGNRYSLISRNCNTFSFHLTKLLGVHHQFPRWVNRLAGVARNVSCILPEGVDQPISNVEPQPAILEPQKPPPIAFL